MSTASARHHPASSRRGGWVLALLAVLTGAGGCQQPPSRAPAVEIKLSSKASVIGTSVEGRPIECLAFGDGPDVVLLIATIHGNESAGTPLLRRLADHVAAQPDLADGRTILLIPIANPDGLARGLRHNSRGVDLNRNFPAGNWQNGRRHGAAALSEPESVALHRLIDKYHPSRIVSLHEPYGCIDYDGPGEALARAMAACTHLPVKKLGGRPGSLGSYAGNTRGIAIITVELPGSSSRLGSDALWDRYGRMLLAAVEFPRLRDAHAVETTR